MKGFTHFMSGIAVATCFPQAVHMASQEQSFILCLGGIFGILPDTLDFKLARYFHRSDFEVRPDPKNLNAQEIADTVAASVKKACETGRSTVQLHTIQLGANLWRSYSLWFDRQAREVVVEIGPLVDTGQVPYVGTEPGDRASARVQVPCGFIQAFDKKSHISIMSGPCFEFVKKGDDVEIVFLPWHRTWSHSVTLGVVMSLLVGYISYTLYGHLPVDPQYLIPRWALYPLICFVGSLVHIIEDSTGFMGNNLFWPVTKNRTQGWGLMSAAEAIPNFFFVWSSIVLILFNLDFHRFAPDKSPSGMASYESYLFWMWAVPVALMWFFFQKGKREKEASKNVEERKTQPDFDGHSTVERETDVSVL